MPSEIVRVKLSIVGCMNVIVGTKGVIATDGSDASLSGLKDSVVKDAFSALIT